MFILTHTEIIDDKEFSSFKGLFDTTEIAIEKYKEKENYKLSIHLSTEEEWITVEETDEENKYEVFHHYPNDKNKYSRGYIEIYEIIVNKIY